jgi:signal transduction histidine kinase
VCIVALLLVILGGILQYTVETILLASVDHDLTIEMRRATGFARMMLLAPARPNAAAQFTQPGLNASALLQPRAHSARRLNSPAPPELNSSDRSRSGQRFRSSAPRFSAPGANSSPVDPTHVRPFAERPNNRPAYAYWPRVLNLDGHLLGQAEDLGPWNRAAFKRAAAGGEQRITILNHEVEVRILSRAVRWKGKVIGVIQVSHPLDEINRAIAGMKRSQLTLVPVALVFAGLCGAVVTRRALRPVGRVVKTAEQIGTHDLSQRLPVTGNDEFSQLSCTFNGMLARLEAGFARQQSLVCQLALLLEQQKRFTADASHELKTPLSIAKVHLSLLRDAPVTGDGFQESIMDIEQAVDRMGRLVQDLLFLAQHDAGQSLRSMTELPVTDVLNQARRNVYDPAGKRIVIEVSDPELTVYGDEDEIVRVFSNLFENAVHHTPRDGEIRATALRQEDTVFICVSDTGVGIAPEHIPHLGERFYRVDTSRARAGGGAGLGLSICKSIIDRHHGTITFESIVGKGTTVTVVLPCCPDHATDA